MVLDRLAVDDTPMHPESRAAAIHRQIDPQILPVPVYEIARALDIVDIEEKALGSLEGVLITDSERDFGIVSVNCSSPRRRRRFSVAHELGHFLCDWHVTTTDGSFHCTRSDMTQPFGDLVHQRQESEANRFAIELLAPEAAMAGWLRRLPDLDHVLSIHRRFDISKAAAARRYVKMHREPLAVIFVADGSFQYSDRGGSFPYINLGRGDPLPSLPSAGRDSNISEMVEADPLDWPGLQSTKGLGVQVIEQKEGRSIILLHIAPAEADPG